MRSVDAICDAAQKLGCTVGRDVPLSSMTTFKTGGSANAVISPNSEENLAKLLCLCTEAEIRPFVLGNGSNVLFPDAGYAGVILHIADGFEQILCKESKIYCGAGVSLSRLCTFALAHALTGLEFAFGIPGCVGGATYMNAGAYGGEMKDVVSKCHHVSLAGEKGERTLADIAFGYRSSIYKTTGDVITGIEFDLMPGDAGQIKEKMNDLLARRKAKQPVEFPSAGSVFKRPEGYFAGTLIEQCGLKGKQIGGAQVSTKHAGFIINTGNATSADVCRLIAYVQDQVKRQTGVALEPEVRVIK